MSYFKDRKLSEIQARDVIAWQNELMSSKDDRGKPYSSTYLKTVHNQLSAIFNHAVKYYNLRSNPAQTAGNMGSEKRQEITSTTACCATATASPRRWPPRRCWTRCASAA